MYESSKHKPIRLSAFLSRLCLHTLIALALLFFSLGLGMFGYMELEHLSAVDAFLNSSMLLGGMGPVNTPGTTSGKLFAGFYALYAGLVFIVAASLIFSPVIHRILHKFHWDSRE